MRIAIDSVRKSFMGNEVLKNINMNVEPGNISLIVGKNGAGKTTILRLILGLYTPDSGDITIDNVSINDPAYVEKKKQIGFLNDNIGLFRDLTTWENLEFFYRIYSPNDNKSKRDEAITNILKKIELYDKRKSKIDFFSRGMRQRLAIGRAIINNPKLLILDEPNRGLDVEGKEMLKDIVNDYHKMGTTILINSHDLNDIQDYVTHLAFLNNGEIVFSGAYKDLLAKQTSKIYKVMVKDTNKVFNLLNTLSFVKHVEVQDDRLLIEVEHDTTELSVWFNDNNIEVYEFVQVNSNLVSLYKNYIK